MRMRWQAGLSEARLVMGMGAATLLLLVGLMAVGSRPDPIAAVTTGEVARLQAELEAARQESESRRRDLDALRGSLAAAPEAGEGEDLWEAVAAENARLKRQVEELTAQLDAARAAGGDGAVGPQLPPVRAAGALAPRVLQDVRVVDVNPGIGYVVIDVGGEHGILPGMRFAVMREGRTVARIVTEDVRENLTGASVNLAEGGTFPMPGDRAVWTNE